MADSKLPESQNGSATSKDTGYVPGDDIYTQFRNIFSVVTGKMSDEGKEQFRMAKAIRNEAADCKRCEDQRDFLLQYSQYFLAWTLLRNDQSSHMTH
jgi:inner membrane protease ATP23